MAASCGRGVGYGWDCRSGGAVLAEGVKLQTITESGKRFRQSKGQEKRKEIMPEIIFTVPGVPVPKARPRFVRGHCFTPQKTTNYEADLKYYFLKSIDNLFTPLDCPIRLGIVAMFPMPKSSLKKNDFGVCLKTTKPDLDNVIKSVCDGLNGVAWVDDARIYYITALKNNSIYQPCVKIKIEW